LTDTSISDADVPLLKCRDQLIVHPVRGAQSESIHLGDCTALLTMVVSTNDRAIIAAVHESAVATDPGPTPSAAVSRSAQGQARDSSP
jgi:hypothetical protein